MRIAIIGGTGDLGKGLALRWAKNHEIILGSRSAEKGAAVAQEYTQIAKQTFGNQFSGSIAGTENSQAAGRGELVVLAVPFESAMENARPLKNVLNQEQIVLSTMVPMKRIDKVFEYSPFIDIDPSGSKASILSAAEMLAKELPPASRIVSGLHTMSAKRLSDLGKPVDCDIVLCGDDSEKVNRISRLVEEIPGVKTYYAGPLRTSSLLESVTPFIINIASHSKKKEPLIKIV
ncbi:MAG: NADPH-dependent F420 reductase [Thaumarchaeota archaeon]|nr:NADPH-dependent F420 reductase [Nitrososphaerota archaeon]